MTLNEMKALMPEGYIKYEPRVNCEYCKGTGIWEEYICICLFVSPERIDENKKFTEFVLEYAKKNLIKKR
jgi:hypothetical protein